MQNQIPHNWQKVKLGNLLRVKHGYAFEGKYFSDKGKYILLTPGNFSEKEGLKLNKIKYFEGPIPSDYVLKKNDLLVVMTDVLQSAPYLGTPGIIDRDGLYLHNQRLGLINNINGKKLDKSFLYWLFQTREIRHQIRASASGSTVKHTAPERIYFCDALIPKDVKEQKKIASILSLFHDKIELNNEIAKILEEMASAIFKEWFVKEANNEKRITYSKIIKNIAYVKTGTRPQQLTQKKENKNIIPTYGAKEIIGYSNKSLYNQQIILTGRVGTIGEVFMVDGLSWPSDNTLILIPKDYNYFYFLYFVAKRINYLSLNRGSSQPLIAQSDIENYLINLPDKNLIIKFNLIFSKLFLLKETKEKENQKLAEMRDLLLPKLMKGEIRV